MLCGAACGVGNLPTGTRTNGWRPPIHAEFGTGYSNAALINDARQNGRRVIARNYNCAPVESVVDEDGLLAPEGWTVFYLPGFHFRTIMALSPTFIFPVPLLMLVCAFAGYDKVMPAYREG